MSQDLPEAPDDAIADGSGVHAPEALADEQPPLAPADDEVALSEDGAAADDEVAGDEEVAAAELPQGLDDATLKRLVEALVFAADKPVTVSRLRQLSRVGDTRRIASALAALGEDYRDRGLVLQCVSGGYQFRTATQFSPYVQQLVAGRPVRLTRAQLETLAIVAYRQPITRPEIDDIRGVDSSNTLRVLSERSLVRILGKKEEVGRPLLYGTTKEFLDFFSLADLRELPTLREYSELSPESRQVMSQKLGELASDSVEPAAEEPAPADVMPAMPEMPDELALAHEAEPAHDIEAGPENDSESDPELASS